MLFKAHVSLLIFCLDDLSIGTSVVLLKSFNAIMLLFPLSLLLAFALHIEDLLCGCVYFCNVYIFFLDQSCDHYVVSFFVSCNCLYFKICFSHIMLILQLSFDFLCKEYLFPSPTHHFQFVCVPGLEAGLLYTAYMWFLFLYPSANICFLVRAFNPFTFKVIMICMFLLLFC